MGWGGVSHLLQIPIFTSGAAITYLLRATWDSADDQGYTDAQELDTAAEGVEDGSLTVVESDGAIAVVSNECVLSGKTVSAWDDLGAYSTSGITKALGYTLLGAVYWSADGGAFYVAWNDAQDVGNPSNVEYGLYLGQQSMATDTGYGAYQVAYTFSGTTDYEFALVLGGYDSNGVPWRSGETAANYLYGCAAYLKGGLYSTWTLIYRFRLGNTSTLYPNFTMQTASGYSLKIDDFRVPDASLSAILQPTALSTFDASNGTGLDAITPEVGGTWTEESGNWDIQSNLANPDGAGIATVDTSLDDCIVECVVNGGSNDNPAIVLRWSDSSNYWYLQADRANNNLELHEVNSGSDDVRATESVTINDSTNYTLMAICYGQTIDGRIDGGSKVQYTSAALNETETEHGIRAEHTDGKFNNFVVFARTSTTYDNTLDAY